MIVCALCGPVPSLPEIEVLIQRYFKQVIFLLTALKNVYLNSAAKSVLDNFRKGHCCWFVGAIGLLSKGGVIFVCAA